jgi:chromosome segregation ATPase
VTSAWLSAAIREFEQVTLENGTELFRVWARARGGDDPEPRPVLVTRDSDGTTHSYEPLASGGDRRGLLRLAYAVATDHIGPSTAFSLRLPDGYRIELPEPKPVANRAELKDDRPWEDAEPGADGRESDDGAARRIAELEQELGDLRSANGELQRRLVELAAERDHAGTALARANDEFKSLRAAHGGVEEQLRSTRKLVGQAQSELQLAHVERDTARQAAESAQAERDIARQAAESAQAERDTARQAAESAQAERDTARQAAESAQAERDTARQAAESAQAERDTARQAAESAQAEREEALRASHEQQAEQARLTARLRQLQARIELLRADASAARASTDPRLRQLETERQQLATHVRALAELLSIDERSAAADGGAELGGGVVDSAAEPLETIRVRAVRQANEDAERELRRLRAGAPR